MRKSSYDIANDWFIYHNSYGDNNYDDDNEGLTNAQWLDSLTIFF